MTSSPADLPTPPPELAVRVGGEIWEYGAIGTQQRVFIEAMLPDGWSYPGKAVLDFGSGAGRTLSAFATEAGTARFVGCDIHEPSIAWAQRELSPPFEFFLCQESPPLPVEAGSFDLIYAMSVFTHITREWSHWIAELHRVLAPGGLALLSVLGPAMAPQFLGRDWDERIGIAMVDMHKDWDIGGPTVFMSEWWIREHLGRAFDVMRFEPSAPGGHDLVLLQRREVPVSPEMLAAVQPSDVREVAALSYNLELLLEQQERLGADVRAQQRQIAELEGLGIRRRWRAIRAAAQRLNGSHPPKTGC